MKQGRDICVYLAFVATAGMPLVGGGCGSAGALEGQSPANDDAAAIVDSGAELPEKDAGTMNAPDQDAAMDSSAGLDDAQGVDTADDGDAAAPASDGGGNAPDVTCDPMRSCGETCIPEAACCTDQDCPPQTAKTSHCDAITNTCRYSCAAGYKACGATSCIPEANCCTDIDCGAPRICDATGACVCSAQVPDLCGGRCVDTKTDPTNCGSCGRDCTSLPHVKAGAGVQCGTGGSCVVPPSACAPGFANCTAGASEIDGCETPINTAANCGACGHVCTVANGTPSCSNGACGVASCDTGYHSCNTTTCYTNDDLAHCGPACNACPEPPSGARALCNGTTGACSFTCNDGFACGSRCYAANVSLSCNGATLCASWDFEPGLQGWALAPSSALNPLPFVDSTHHVSGGRSLMLSFSNESEPIRLEIALCNQSIILGGRTIKAQIFIDADPTGPTYATNAVYSNNDSGDADSWTELMPHVWNSWSEPLLFGPTTHEGLTLELSGSGRAYIDDIQIVP